MTTDPDNSTPRQWEAGISPLCGTREYGMSENESGDDVVYPRGRLINICEGAIVHESRWRNRDTHEAQSNVGYAWAMLQAGVPYTVRRGEYAGDPCVTDEQTIWLSFHPYGFCYFDMDEERGHETAYLPTEQSLDAATGDDWY